MMVDGWAISLDKEILAKICRLPKGQHKVGLWLSATQSAVYEPRRFNVEAACKNGYYWKKGTDQLITERILFQRYALQMQENGMEVSSVKIYEAKDIKQAQGLVVLPPKEAV